MKRAFTMYKIIPTVGFITMFLLTLVKQLERDLNFTQIFSALSLFILIQIIFSYALYTNEQIYFSDLKNLGIYTFFLSFSYVSSLFMIEINVYIPLFLLGIAFIGSIEKTTLSFLSVFYVVSCLAVSTISDLRIFLLYLFSGIFLTFTIQFAKSRQQIIYVAFSNGLMNMLLLVMIEMYLEGNLKELGYLNMMIIGFSGAMVVILAIGSEPLWEGLFHITTEARLLELSNSNQPLLKRLLMEAPGTYHHSLLVSNLAEKAAMEIGCNYQLARVGALYHDIGKLKNPTYFTENQKEKNIHDEIAPDASAAYIIDHITEGLRLAKEHKLPKEIQDMIVQHQGDATLTYFYNKAVDHSDGYDIDKKIFSYPGPKPRSKEAAILMLADCVEAAIKSLKENERSTDQIKPIIQNVILTVFKANQLNEAPLLFNELPLIARSFIQVYNGMYHERVKYDRNALPQERIVP
ncbi:MAG: HDIG domain-containing protein [Vallitaleaceae bacterium]|nr:HDIG domain-containing protein [Vallitaleaceae bacterium]